MRIDNLRDLIKKHEGLVLHSYQDSLGYWTIGYGRLIDPAKGGGITQLEAECLLTNDIASIEVNLRRYSWFKSLDEVRGAVVVSMAFQMGLAGFLGFKKTIALIASGDYLLASDEMLNSKWARQTPGRAEELSDMMATGKWQ